MESLNFSQWLVGNQHIEAWRLSFFFVDKMPLGNILLVFLLMFMVNWCRATEWLFWFAMPLKKSLNSPLRVDRLRKASNEGCGNGRRNFFQDSNLPLTNMELAPQQRKPPKMMAERWQMTWL